MELADVLSGDAGLAGVRRLLLGARARGVLRHELATMLGDPRLLGAFRIRRAKFKPGRKLTAYYDVDLRDARGTPLGCRPIAVTWADQDMQVLVSPTDERFPHLVRLVDPSFVGEMLGASRCRVTTIRYRPGQRHVLRYDIQRLDGARESVFAKLYEEGGEARRTFQVATRVADWLTAAGEGHRAVRPLSLIADSPAVLYSALAGGPLSRRLAHLDGTRASELHRAGGLLRTLHGAPRSVAEWQDPYPLDTELSAAARASEHVEVLLRPARPRIAAILARARELHEQLPQERPTLAHGDFKLDHLWLGPDGLTLIDLDKCCVADPALDIGKLLADLHWSHLMGHLRGVPEAQRQFLEGYGALWSSPLIHRARLYEAILLVKIAGRRVPVFDRRWGTLTQTLIERAERTLLDLEYERHRPEAALAT
jgi:aminoglycoside phosphotransferase (APT) family kinase protein